MKNGVMERTNARLDLQSERKEPWICNPQTITIYNDLKDVETNNARSDLQSERFGLWICNPHKTN